MEYRVVPMTVAYAERIARWHYSPPYDCYDVPADPDDHQQFLDPVNWPDVYYAVLDPTRRDDTLVGFFSFESSDDTVEVGLGLRPDLTGQGYGTSFLQAGLDFARDTYDPARFVLDVATFNERAVRVYERCGFEADDRFERETNGAPQEFLRMTRPV